MYHFPTQIIFGSFQENLQRKKETEEELVRRLRKQEEKDYLKDLLTQLTNEMRAKYQNDRNCDEQIKANEQSSSISQIIGLSPSPLAKEAFSLVASPKASVVEVETSTTLPGSEEPSTPLAFVVTASEVKADARKVSEEGPVPPPLLPKTKTIEFTDLEEEIAVTKSTRSETEGQIKVEEVETKVIKVIKEEPEDLRSQVEKFRLKQEEVLQNLTVQPAKMPPTLSKAKLNPDVVDSFWHHPKPAAVEVPAERPFEPDAYNVMSSARRKMYALMADQEAEKANKPKLSLSEGPISSTEEDLAATDNDPGRILTSTASSSRRNSRDKRKTKAKKDIINIDSEVELEPVKDEATPASTTSRTSSSTPSSLSSTPTVADAVRK